MSENQEFAACLAGIVSVVLSAIVVAVAAPEILLVVPVVIAAGAFGYLMLAARPK